MIYAISSLLIDNSYRWVHIDNYMAVHDVDRSSIDLESRINNVVQLLTYVFLHDKKAN